MTHLSLMRRVTGVDNNATLVIAGPGVLANDADIDSPALTAVLVTGPTTGTLVLNPDGSFSYTPLITFTGSETFVYVANDGSLDSPTVTVTITVSASAAPPPPSPDPSPPPVDPPDDSPEDEEEEDSETDNQEAPGPIEQPTDGSRGRDRSTGATVALLPGPLPSAAVDDAAEQILVLQVADSSSASRSGSSRVVEASLTSAPQRFHSVDLATSAEFTPLALQRSLLWSQLDTLEQEIVADEDFVSHVAGSATVVTAAISTGYVMWALRGSFLIASFLSTVPTWRSLDPLPIVDGPGDEEEDHGNTSRHRIFRVERATGRNRRSEIVGSTSFV